MPDFPYGYVPYLPTGNEVDSECSSAETITLEWPCIKRFYNNSTEEVNAHGCSDAVDRYPGVWFVDIP
jgi:hypothetical protein